MSTNTDEDTGRMRRIADAYRWQRRLGHAVFEMPFCGIVTDPAHPDLWDANHADNVTAHSEGSVDAVLKAMDTHLAHSNWRVVHTNTFTPEPFLARLAYLEFHGATCRHSDVMSPAELPKNFRCRNRQG
jgi:hypothetical protein